MPWFKEWFNSPYYHKLYGKRDHKEAEELINKLLNFIQAPADWKFLDLACGKGRHAAQIAGKGYETYGVDLSPDSIVAANEIKKPNLHFEVHDMRQTFKSSYFDVVLNLFTSFGYFDCEDDNILALNAVKSNLKSNGLFIQDYFNAHKVVATLKAKETKLIDGIEFHIEKHIENKKVVKNIRFTDKDVEYRFCEVVSLFDKEDFERFYSKAGFEILHVFGDYALNEFDANNSDRLLIISKSV